MKRIVVIALLSAGLITACNQGENKNNEQAEEVKQEVSKKNICLELSYPITYKLPDGSTVAGQNRAEVSTALKAWHAANPDIQERAVMQFPVKAIFQGKPVSILNEVELEYYRKACAETRIPCYTFIFPVSYIMPDGIVITVLSEDDAENKAAIRTWYANNPELKERRPDMKYPLSVKLRDGSSRTVGSLEELHALREECD